MIPGAAGGCFHIRVEVQVCDAYRSQCQRIACAAVYLIWPRPAVQEQENANGIQLAEIGRAHV